MTSDGAHAELGSEPDAPLADLSDRVRETRRQRLLASAAHAFAASFDYADRLQYVARLPLPELADFCAVDMVQPHGQVERVAAAHADPELADLARCLAAYPPVLATPGGAAEALRTGEILCENEVSLELLEAVARDEEHRDLLRRLSPRAFLVVPMIARGQTLGALSLVSTSDGRRYGPPDAALAAELANLLALAIDNARLYEQARTASQARDEILRVVSHELRTPINAVRLIGGVLQQSLTDRARTREREGLETIDLLTEQMARLVDDLLDVAQIEAGHLRVRPEPIEIRGVLAEVHAALGPLADDAGVRLVIEPAGPLPLAMADRHRTLQVLGNLVSNAIRVTAPGGSITLAAGTEDGAIRISVADSGRGIAADRLDRLFDRFWSGDGSGRANAGLGLAIARGIVEAQGGRIEVAGQVGRGTTFSFTIPPAERGSDVAVAEASRAPGGPTREPRRTDASPPERPPGGSREEGHRRAGFLADLQAAIPAVSSGATLDRLLADRILGAIHTGGLRPGDRLPSIRALARALGASRRAVVNAYSRLEAGGILRPRSRSGVYLAALDLPGDPPPGETARWLVDVLAGACDQHVRIPYLPELIRRSTTAARLHCACIDSDSDSVAALCREAEHHFGLEASEVDVASLPDPISADPRDATPVPPHLAHADILITTAFHAPRVRPWADRAGVPLVVASLHPDIVTAIREHLRRQRLTVVCTDRRYGERIRALFSITRPERVRIVGANDPARVQRIDSSEPVLLTWAARPSVGDSPLRLLVPVSPICSAEFSRELSRVLLRRNLEVGRL